MQDSYLVNKYHIWDARNISELFSGKKLVNVTITSPPYWDLKDYEIKSQIGFGQTYKQYLDDLEKVFRDIYEISTLKGSLWIISDTVKHKGKILLLPFDLANRLEKTGWILQDIIIWNKDRTLPWSHQGKLRNIFEYITFYSKTRKFNYNLNRVREINGLKDWWIRYPERYSPAGKAPARTWNIPIPRQGSWGENWVRHFNPLPTKLVERILLLTTNRGDVVFDPFCGSGIVLAQAHVMERKYIGLDLNENYRNMFEKRVLPAIRNLNKYIQNEATIMEIKKRKFGELIRSLRRTKYPKEILRLYMKKNSKIEINAVIVLKRKSDEHLHIFFIFSHVSKIPKDFISNVNKICSRPPLSKYGIKPKLRTFTVNILSEDWLNGLGLDLNTYFYLYKNGRTYSWERKMSFKDLLDIVKKDVINKMNNKNNMKRIRYPIIVSNLKVKVVRNSPLFPSRRKVNER